MTSATNIINAQDDTDFEKKKNVNVDVNDLEFEAATKIAKDYGHDNAMINAVSRYPH